MFGGKQVRGDKVIVFSDNIFALREYAVRLQRPFIYGGTSHGERTRILSQFKRSSNVSSLLPLPPGPAPCLPSFGPFLKGACCDLPSFGPF